MAMASAVWARPGAAARAARCAQAAPVQCAASRGAVPVGSRLPPPGREANATALPAPLRAGIEALAGLALGDVQVRRGSSLPARYGALATTQGAEIHLAPGQDHHLPHEAWHVVQQKQGRVNATRPAGNGLAAVNDNPALEAEADVMGQRAVRAVSTAAALLPGQPATAPAASLPGQGVVQRFTPTLRKGLDWRLADDGQMAVQQESPVYGGRFFYADSGLIASSESTLKSQNSALSLAGGGSRQFVSPVSGANISLTRVVPTNRSDGSTGNDRASGMQWSEDCGLAANTVMQGGGRKTKAVYRLPEAPAAAGFWAKLGACLRRQLAGEQETATVSYGTVYEKYRGRNFYSPHKMLDDVMADAMSLGPSAAWAGYQALSATDRDNFDREVGLNKYAAPEVGEAYSIVSNKDENIDQKVWNFHWGGVVMKSGGDAVTMENFAGSGTDAWDFQMYGPASKAGQTFHEQQSSRTKADGVTPEYGDHPTTLHVRPEP